MRLDPCWELIKSKGSVLRKTSTTTHQSETVSWVNVRSLRRTKSRASLIAGFESVDYREAGEGVTDDDA